MRKPILLQLLEVDVTGTDVLGVQTAVEINGWYCRESRHCMFLYVRKVTVTSNVKAHIILAICGRLLCRICQ